MCIQDWRFGRLVRSVMTAKSLLTTETNEVTSNKQRVGISFNLGTVGIASPNRMLLQADNILVGVLLGEDTWRHFTLTEHGDLVQRAWLLKASGATMNSTIIEYFLPEEFLTAAIDQFNKEYGK